MSHPGLTHLEPANRIKQLCSQGNVIVVDGKIPLRRYFRSGQEMVRMANVYADEGSLENAFILYMKFMTLFIEKIRTHPEYSTHSSTDKTASNKRVKEILPVAERLKSQLREKYQREYNTALQEHLREEEERKQRQKQQEEEEERRRKRQQQDSQRRREEAEEEEEVERRIQELQELSLHPSRRRRGGEAGEEEAPPPPYDALGSVSYPIAELASPSAPPSAPQYPPSPAVTPYMPSRDLKPSSTGVPQVDRSSKPVSLLGARSGGLREVRVPAQLMPNFMSLAHSNTARNVETCGVLAGHLAQHKLLVTHLLVPKQCGTADSCTTQQEEELFDHQDKLDLITIGWIHTHPSQTAFLSSVDLHTHCSYQLMMPEAIAIVCAPKYQETGFFTLSPHHGLPFIANCHQSGFHPHPKEPPLFQNADHVTLDSSLAIKVIDLRNS